VAFKTFKLFKLFKLFIFLNIYLIYRYLTIYLYINIYLCVLKYVKIFIINICIRSMVYFFKFTFLFQNNSHKNIKTLTIKMNN